MATLLAYLELENPKVLRYRMQACGKLMDEAPLVRHVTRSGGHMHDGHVHVGNAHEDIKQLYERPQLDRAGALFRRKKKKGKARLPTSDEADKVVRRAFQTYSTGRHRRGRGEHFIEFRGCMRCLRDTQLFDNNFTAKDAADVLEGLGNGSRGGIMDLGIFEALLQRVAARKFPKAPSAEEAFSMLIAVHLAPYIKLGTIPDEDLEALMTPEVQEVIAPFQGQLKKVYAHYSTLSLVSFHQSTWTSVQRANRAQYLEEFVTFLLNFEVMPTLLNKQNVIEIFELSNHDVYFAEEQAPLGLMTFPQFVEGFGRCALHIVENLEAKIQNRLTTVTELNAFKKLVLSMPTDSARAFYGDLLLQRRSVSQHLPPEELKALLEAKAKDMERGRERDENLQEQVRKARILSMKRELSLKMKQRHAITAAKVREYLHPKPLAEDKHLQVTIGTLRPYMQKEIDGMRMVDLDGGTTELDAFEENLESARKLCWKTPGEEMLGWAGVAAVRQGGGSGRGRRGLKSLRTPQPGRHDGGATSIRHRYT